VSEAGAISESVLRDFKGFRRHFRSGPTGGGLSRSTGPTAPQKEEQISSGETEAFRQGARKPLISLMAPNQSFRGIMSFQELSRRFVSLFSHFLPGADLAPLISNPTSSP
jgi:hypothetical protein